MQCLGHVWVHVKIVVKCYSKNCMIQPLVDGGLSKKFALKALWNRIWSTAGGHTSAQSLSHYRRPISHGEAATGAEPRPASSVKPCSNFFVIKGNCSPSPTCDFI